MRALAAAVLALGLAGAGALAPAAAAAPPRGAAERPWLTPARVGDLKLGIALAGAALLAWGAAVPARSPPARRARAALWAGLGAAAALGWSNFGAFNHPGFGHPSDTFHYYVGSKYFRELGYDGLYACAAVADAEAGLAKHLERRHLRDLSTNLLVPVGAALARPEACTARFSPERWQAFQQDLAWFRNRVTVRRWKLFHTDHGYNASPVWTALGGTLANAVPATDAGIHALRLLDPLLLAAMWAAVIASFGWRAACVGLLYWGTNYPAQYGWIGGSYLRQSWLVATVLALCALRRGRAATAGGLLALAVGLRVFPILVVAALGLRALVAMARARRVFLSHADRRLLAGGLAGGLALLALSLAAGGGVAAWQGFVENSRTHLATPLRNHLGLPTVVSFVPVRAAQELRIASSDPYAAWKQARRNAGKERRWLFAALVVGYLTLLARAAAHVQHWEMGVLGLGLVVIASELTCYYSAGLLAFGLLWRSASIGVALCLLSAAGWAIANTGRPWEEVFTGISLASAVFVGFATLRLARPGPAEAGSDPGALRSA
jgi:hypothetical protein